MPRTRLSCPCLDRDVIPIAESPQPPFSFDLLFWYHVKHFFNFHNCMSLRLCPLLRPQRYTIYVQRVRQVCQQHFYALPTRTASTTSFHNSIGTAMPPKAPEEDKPTAIFGTKRKNAESGDLPIKKPKGDFPAYKESTDEEKYGIIDREFYPPEMTNARCAQYNDNEIPRPIELLEKALKDTELDREHTDVNNAVVHWFKCDLRTKDNKALHLASEKAKANGVPLICIHIISPQDYKAHCTSAVRVDFVLRTL